MAHTIAQADCITIRNRPRIYVGYGKNCLREMFKSAVEPVRTAFGAKYLAVVGPFRTVRGAKAMIHYGENNPHIQHVRDAERIGKKYATKLKSMPTSKGPKLCPGHDANTDCEIDQQSPCSDCNAVEDAKLERENQ